MYGAWLGAPYTPTILVYGHYDVQPPDPVAEWRSPPFEPTERDGRRFARGASDDKGSSAVAIGAVAAFLRNDGACPVNVKVFLEGEEEVGSPSLRAIVARHGALLGADAVVSADGGRASPTVPTVNVGARGNTGIEITLTTAAKDLHSGKYGGAVRNALHEMARLVGRPARPRRAYSGRGLPRRRAAARAAGRARLHAAREPDAAPSIDVNGTWGGYTGAGGKTVIPRQAHAKLTMLSCPPNIESAPACRPERRRRNSGGG